jgi:hypothetical protein
MTFCYGSWQQPRSFARQLSIFFLFPSHVLSLVEQNISAQPARKGKFKFKPINEVTAALKRKRKTPPAESPSVSDGRHEEPAAFQRVSIMLSYYCNEVNRSARSFVEPMSLHLGSLLFYDLAEEGSDSE